MEKLNMLIDIYEEEVVGVHSVGDKITEKEEAWICSKKFGFIKWLVDNDKIYREGMKGHGRLISYCLYVKSWEWDKIKEGVLLMLLSIQDEPIEFLISILK